MTTEPASDGQVRPGIRLFVAMFDRTARSQLERTVSNSVVRSPAAIAAPSMVAAAIAIVALVGRRVMPRSGHVVVTGMGQVGARAALRRRWNPPYAW